MHIHSSKYAFCSSAITKVTIPINISGNGTISGNFIAVENKYNYYFVRFYLSITAGGNTTGCGGGIFDTVDSGLEEQVESKMAAKQFTNVGCMFGAPESASQIKLSIGGGGNGSGTIKGTCTVLYIPWKKLNT